MHKSASDERSSVFVDRLSGELIDCSMFNYITVSSDGFVFWGEQAKRQGAVYSHG
jgi:hypothetical protein